MRNQSAIFRQASFYIAGLSLLVSGSAVCAQPFADCPEALHSPGGAVSLAAGAPIVLVDAVDQWDSDIVKVRVARPGILVLSGEGAEAQAMLYAVDPISGAPRHVDGGQVGTAHRPLTTAVRSGEHCVRLAPPPGSTGRHRLQATFFDVCHLGLQDDHGDSFLCATEITLGETQAGEITPGDQDLFSFVLTGAASVAIGVTGPAGLSVGLYGEDGTRLAAATPGTQALGAGRYYLRVAGAEGAYGLTVTADHP